MSRRRVALAAVVGVPLLLAVAIAVASTWLLTTAGGLEWAAAQARRHLPEGVTFERVEGRLTGPLELYGLRLRTQAARVRVGRVSLDWDPLALLAGRLRVTRLVLGPVDVALAPGDPAAGTAGGGVPALPAELALPLRVAVDRAAVNEVRVQLPDGRVERIERLAVTVTAGPRRGLALSHLALAAPRGDASGHLRLAPAAPFALAGELDWELVSPAPGVAAMAGRLELDGSLAQLRARLVWREPAMATVALEARLFRARPQWRADVTLPDGPLRAWWDAAPALAAGAELRLDGDLERATVRGEVRVDGLPSGPLAAQVDAAATAGEVTIERLHLGMPRRPGAELVAGGRIGLGSGPPQLDLELQWRRLGWPLDAPAVATSESGRVSLRGTPEDYRLAGSARLRAGPTGDAPVRLDWEGRGSTAGLRGLRLDAAWRGARLDATVESLRWAAPAELHARLELAGLDPGAFVPALAGRLGGRARLDATWGDAASARLVLERLDGELHGQALAGGGTLGYGPEGLRIERLALRAGAASARVAGRLAQSGLALDWQLDIPDLGALVARYGGRLHGSGRVTGTPAAPRVRVDLEATGLLAPGVAIDEARVGGVLTAAPGERSDLRVALRRAQTPAGPVQSLAATLTGTPAAHDLGVELRSARGDADLALAGALVDGGWQGRLERARLTPAGRRAWTLAAPAALGWRDGAFDAGEACFTRSQARLCARGRAEIGAATWTLRVDGRSIPVAAVGAYWREALDYTGRFDLRAELGASGGPVTGRLQLETGPGRLIGPLANETTTLLEYGTGRADLRLGPEAVRVEARLPLAGDGLVALRARVARAAPRTLSGRIEARIAELGLVTVLAPAVGRVDGRLLADLELGGSVDTPSLAGSVRLADGRLSLLPLGIELTRLEADIGTDDGAMRVDARASSGPGRLQAELRLARAAAGDWAGSGTISGTDFEALALPEARVVVSPALDWRVDGRSVTVEGDVAVPTARIEPRDLSGSVQASPDAVVVGREASQQPTVPGWEVRADVAVALGPQVHIDAFGLDGRLGGEIRIEEQPGRLTTASGELRVEEGTYTIYRQTLQIERGRVIFGGGPIADPGLDVRAVRRPRDVLVGVNVRGTLRAPRVELFSEPPMPESQQLSYLLVGLPLGETSSGEQSTVAAAAAALARSRPGSRLAGELGIDEVTVDQATPGEGASVVLGRYLSPRLYVGYGIGLMEQANSVRMRYELTDHWTLEARSGVTSSADLLYSIEVDASVDAIPLRAADDDAGAADADGE